MRRSPSSPSKGFPRRSGLLFVTSAADEDGSARRAEALSNDTVFEEQEAYKAAERVREDALERLDQLVETLLATHRLIVRCRQALQQGDGTAVVATGGFAEFEFAIEDTDSELLQVSGVTGASMLYPDLNPGKAVLRTSQLLDAAFVRDNLKPPLLTLDEEEQKLVISALLQSWSEHLNPENPMQGRYELISLIDSGKSLRQRLGSRVEEALQLATNALPKRRVIPIAEIAG
jgi:hypothetical protein